MPAGVSPLIVMTLTGEPRTFTSCDEWPGALEQICCREDAKHREHECKLRRDTEQDSDPGSEISATGLPEISSYGVFAQDGT